MDCAIAERFLARRIFAASLRRCCAGVTGGGGSEVGAGVRYVAFVSRTKRELEWCVLLVEGHDEYERPAAPIPPRAPTQARLAIVECPRCLQNLVAYARVCVERRLQIEDGLIRCMEPP